MARPKKITRAEAVRLGKRRYFTGKLCVNRHRAERRTLSGGCMKCARKSSAKYNARNPSQTRKANRAGVRRHQETVRLRMGLARKGVQFAEPSVSPLANGGGANYFEATSGYDLRLFFFESTRF